MLGYWQSHPLGDHCYLYLGGLKRLEPLDRFANRTLSGFVPADRNLKRLWTVQVGESEHIQLCSEQRSDSDEPEGYWLRCIRMERLGDKACFAVMYLRLGADPGPYHAYMFNRRVVGHLPTVESLRVEAR